MSEQDHTIGDACVVIEIPRDSEAFRLLKQALTMPRTDRVRLAVDGDTFKIKRNEGMWTHPLSGATVRPLHTPRP